MAPALLIPVILGGLLAVALLIRKVYGKVWLFRTIFETDTPAGKTFDVVLLVAIVVSVVAVVIESDPVLRVTLRPPVRRAGVVLHPAVHARVPAAAAVRGIARCATPAASSGWWICSRSCPASWACW